MTPRIAVLTGALLAGLAPSLHAQGVAADSAWIAGDYPAAQRQYEAAISAQPDYTRGWYRLGILASWSGDLDSALVLLRHARDLEPEDMEIRLAEARVLSWAGRNREADSVYRWVLARDPDNSSAAVGRARLRAWSGDLDGAIAEYQAILAAHPDDPEALTALGEARFWQGRIGLARVAVAQALQAEPGNREAATLAATLRRATRTTTALTLGWSHDSDDNTAWWQTLEASRFLADGVTGFASAGAYEATDPTRDGVRLSAEVGGRFPVHRLALTAALGVRHLNPDSGGSRSELTLRAAAGFRITGSASGSVSYAHYPFDETALLIARNLDVDALDAALDVTLRPGLVASAGGGAAWLSDGNSRLAGVLALTRAMTPRWSLGAFARMMGYDRPGFGYFTPDRFSVLEARTAYAITAAPWTARLSGGLGIQQVGKGASAQSEWHLEGRGGRTWGADDGNSAEVFAGVSNSAESSTTGAFRYYTAGVVVRIGW